MKNSSIPNIPEPSNFDNFIKYRSGMTRTNLLNIKKKIPYYYRHYQSHGSNVHEIKPNKLGVNEKQTMINVYESYTSNAIKEFRDALFEHMPECPYCGLAPSEHLDHYLPKSEFSEYALYSLNLIPCCYHCNSTYKKTGYEEHGRRVYFHPYVDNINGFDILRATVQIKTAGIILHYGISQSSGLDSNTMLV